MHECQQSSLSSYPVVMRLIASFIPSSLYRPSCLLALRCTRKEHRKVLLQVSPCHALQERRFKKSKIEEKKGPSVCYTFFLSGATPPQNLLSQNKNPTTFSRRFNNCCSQ